MYYTDYILGDIPVTSVSNAAKFTSKFGTRSVGIKRTVETEIFFP